MLGKIVLPLRVLFRRSELDRELDEELRFHLEREIEENIRRGMSPERARRVVQRRPISTRSAIGQSGPRRSRGFDTRNFRSVCRECGKGHRIH